MLLAETSSCLCERSEAIQNPKSSVETESFWTASSLTLLAETRSGVSAGKMQAILKVLVVKVSGPLASARQGGLLAAGGRRVNFVQLQPAPLDGQIAQIAQAKVPPRREWRGGMFSSNRARASVDSTGFPTAAGAPLRQGGPLFCVFDGRPNKPRGFLLALWEKLCYNERERKTFFRL